MAIRWRSRRAAWARSAGPIESAHVYTQVVFQGGAQAIAILRGPDARQRLAGWWSDCGSAPVPAELAVQTVETDGDLALVVTP